MSVILCRCSAMTAKIAHEELASRQTEANLTLRILGFTLLVFFLPSIIQAKHETTTIQNLGDDQLQNKVAVDHPFLTDSIASSIHAFIAGTETIFIIYEQVSLHQQTVFFGQCVGKSFNFCFHVHKSIFSFDDPSWAHFRCGCRIDRPRRRSSRRSAFSRTLWFLHFFFQFRLCIGNVSTIRKPIICSNEFESIQMVVTNSWQT